MLIRGHNPIADLLEYNHEIPAMNPDITTGVAAPRKRTALNLREKCGGLPTRRHVKNLTRGAKVQRIAHQGRSSAKPETKPVDSGLVAAHQQERKTAQTAQGQCARLGCRNHWSICRESKTYVTTLSYFWCGVLNIDWGRVSTKG